MIESGVAFTLFDKILNGIGLIREGKKKRTKQIDNALFALYAALHETKPYLDDRRNGKRRNRKRELEIARLWHAASIPLRFH